MSAGLRSRPEATIRRWQPFQNAAGTVLGYIDAQLPSRMIVNGCKLMAGPKGKHWVAMPAEKAMNKDGTPKLDAPGKQVWTQFIDFADATTRAKFGDMILDALRREHPEAFER